MPPRLEDVILKGLEKDRELRYQTAAELRGDLKRLKRDASSGKLAFAPVVSTAAQGAAPLSSGAIIVAEARRRKGALAVAAIMTLGLVAAAAYGIYALIRSDRRSTVAAPPAEPMSVTRLTTSGDVRGCGAISPDGKYVVYCDFSNRLYVRQVATGSTVKIADIAGDSTFSPDGNFVYLTAQSDEYPDGVLWAIAALGGDARRVVTNLKGAVGVAPDGQRVAFVREDRVKRESALIVTDTYGANERRLAVGSTLDSWFEGPAVSWSADGQLLSATQATVVGGYRMRPVVVEVGTGKVDVLGPQTVAASGPDGLAARQPRHLVCRA